jgi:hypothetical protein
MRKGTTTDQLSAGRDIRRVALCDSESAGRAAAVSAAAPVRKDQIVREIRRAMIVPAVVIVVSALFFAAVVFYGMRALR